VRVLSLVLVTLAGFALAPGVKGFAGGWFAPYAWLCALVPGFENMRAPSRFGCIASFGLSALAGLGIASLLAACRRRRGAMALRAAVAGLALLGVLGPPRVQNRAWPIATARDLPAAYRWLAEHGEGGPLLEMPIGGPSALWGLRAAAKAMYFSTYHWLPLLNGHTSYVPRSYAVVKATAMDLPDRAALQRLVDCAGLRWILVHAEGQRSKRPWEGLVGLELRASFPHDHRMGPDRLFEATVPPRPPALRHCAGW
jgi:hypothetical protein